MTDTTTQPVPATAADQPPEVVKTEANPNQWSLLNEYLKTVITLSGVLLGVTVAFVGRPLSNQATTVENGLLVGVLLFLFLAIIFALWGAAILVGYVRSRALGRPDKSRRNGSILSANIAFFSLGLAGLCLFALGTARAFDRGETLAAGEVMVDVFAALETAVAQRPSEFELLSYSANAPTDEMATIEVLETNSAQEYVIVYSISDRSVQTIERKP